METILICILAAFAGFSAAVVCYGKSSGDTVFTGMGVLGILVAGTALIVILGGL